MDELVQYFIVNSELNMSPGKVAAQIAHIATDIAIEFTFEAMYDSEENRDFWDWHKDEQKKVILRGKQKDLEKLIDYGFNYIRDKGYTEIPEGSLTVCGLPPMKRSEAQKYVKRLQLYK